MVGAGRPFVGSAALAPCSQVEKRKQDMATSIARVLEFERGQKERKAAMAQMYRDRALAMQQSIDRHQQLAQQKLHEMEEKKAAEQARKEAAKAQREETVARLVAQKQDLAAKNKERRLEKLLAVQQAQAQAEEQRIINFEAEQKQRRQKLAKHEAIKQVWRWAVWFLFIGWLWCGEADTAAGNGCDTSNRTWWCQPVEAHAHPLSMTSRPARCVSCFALSLTRAGCCSVPVPARDQGPSTEIRALSAILSFSMRCLAFRLHCVLVCSALSSRVLVGRQHRTLHGRNGRTARKHGLQTTTLPMATLLTHTLPTTELPMAAL